MENVSCKTCNESPCGHYNECPPTKRPYATKTKRRTYTVTEEVHAQLRDLGNGNASAGIREAVQVAKENKQ